MPLNSFGRSVVPMIALLLVGSSALAGSGHRAGLHHGPRLGALLDFHAEAIGLDAETRETIRGIVESSHARSDTLRGEIRAERRVLHELMEMEPVDRDAIMEQLDRVAGLQAEAERHRIETLLRIREQLTPEQRAALVEFRERMHARDLGPIRDACEQELSALCPGGGPRGFHCLLRHREGLSEACHEAIGSLPPHFGHGGCRHKHGSEGAPYGSEGAPGPELE